MNNPRNYPNQQPGGRGQAPPDPRLQVPLGYTQQQPQYHGVPHVHYPATGTYGAAFGSQQTLLHPQTLPLPFGPTPVTLPGPPVPVYGYTGGFGQRQAAVSYGTAGYQRHLYQSSNRPLPSAPAGPSFPQSQSKQPNSSSSQPHPPGQTQRGKQGIPQLNKTTTGRVTKAAGVARIKPESWTLVEMILAKSTMRTEDRLPKLRQWRGYKNAKVVNPLYSFPQLYSAYHTGALEDFKAEGWLTFVENVQSGRTKTNNYRKLHTVLERMAQRRVGPTGLA